MNKKAILPPHFFRGKNSKVLLTFLLISLIVFSVGTLFIKQASAQLITIFEYTYTSGYKSYVSSVHPTITEYPSLTGNCFIADETAYITNLAVYVAKVGTPTGTLNCALYSVTGNVTLGTAIPNSFIELSPTGYVSADLSTTHYWYTFIFSGMTQLIDGEQYAIVFFKYEGTDQTIYHFSFEGTASTTGDTVHGIVYKNGGFIKNGDASLRMKIYGSETPSGTPTPPPSSTPLPIEEWESRKKNLELINSPNGDITWEKDYTIVDGKIVYPSSATEYGEGNYTIPFWTRISVNAKNISTGYYFDYFEVYYEDSDETVEVYTLPMRLRVTEDMTITLYTTDEEPEYYNVTIKSVVGGYIEMRFLDSITLEEFYDEMFLTSYIAGTYTFSSDIYVNFRVHAYDGYEFNKFKITDKYGVTTNYISEILQYSLTGNTIVDAELTELNPDTTIPVEDGLTPILVSLNNFFFGEVGVLGAGFGLIILIIICVLLLMLAGKSLEVLIVGVVVSTIINVAVGIWELWTIILIIIAIVAIALKNTGYLGSGNNGE